MFKDIEITCFPKDIYNTSAHISSAANIINIPQKRILEIKILKRSIDARQRPIYRLKVRVFIDKVEHDNPFERTTYMVRKDQKTAIIGFGPAGMFAALKLLESGLKPVIFERGKDVQSRRRDIRNLMRDHLVNPDSNYCFGEGGAGAYSDGKLYTRSLKRGSVNEILRALVEHGASEEILIDAHPHIGSNKLPKVVNNIRQTILNGGGEIYFDSKLTDIIIDNSKVIGIIINDKEEFVFDNVILCVGHSARDVYELLNRKNIKLEQKDFAMGVRIEHPQQIIDEIQYKQKIREVNLPAASYNLSCQIDERGVYSFCMCPGGIIVPASTNKEELVLNGMSVSRRNSRFANSGFVVSVTRNDLKNFEKHGIFAGLEYQKYYENLCFIAGGSKQTAPAQRITDFVNGDLSVTLPETSYIPGVISTPLHEIIPKEIRERMKKALLFFGQKKRGYFTEEAQILAPESRTSSPVRIPRDKVTFEHVQVSGLFPCGEGAGYAGGIVSAAIDGRNCATAVINKLKQ
ncbi:MAG: FAD-binding protein [Melioribacteraceae bacterium]|nr:FAD-binding protein [Melioribacteraceae bacterium]